MDLKSPLVTLFFLLVNIKSISSACQNKPAIKGNVATFTNIDSTLPSPNLETSYDAKGLQPFFNLANSFMNTVQSKSIGKHFKGMDFDEILDSKNRDKLKDYEVPILVAAGFGLLFALLMPLIGMCFCCCRNCNKCGGRKFQDPKAASQHTACCIMGFILLVVTIFMLCGALFMFVTNNRFHDTSKSLGDTYTDTLDDVINIANSTVETGLSIANNFVPCVIDLVLDDVSVNGIKLHVGSPLQTAVKNNVSKNLQNALQQSEDITKVYGELKNIVELTNVLETTVNNLKTELDGTKGKMDTVETNCRTDVSIPDKTVCDKIAQYKSMLNVNIDVSSFPDVTSERDKLKEIVDKNLKGSIEKAQKVVDDIPDTVVSKSQSARDDVIKAANDALPTIRKNIEDITENLKSNVINKKPSWSKHRKDYLSTDSDHFKYENYRWYSYIGLSCLMTLIVVLLGLGLTFGVCGYHKNRLPSNRTKTATCGGNCLMAAVGFMFLFSFFLMIFCVVWYFVGIHLYLVCQDLKDGQLIDDVTSELKWDGKKVSVQTTLANCRKNMALYGALNGEKYYNLSAKLDIKKHTSDINNKIDSMTFDLSDQTVLSPDTKDSLNKAINSGADDVNYTKFFITIKEKITDQDLDEVADNLTKIATSLQSTSPTVAGGINEIATDLKTAKRGTVSQIGTNLNFLESNVTGAQAKASNLKASATNLLDELSYSENFVKINTIQIIKDNVKILSERINGWLEQGSSFLINQVKTNLLRCKPIADLYDGFINTLVCNNVVQNANGFWLALGWCMLFFVPAIILSVKLAKYFRRMDYDAGYDQTPHPPYNDKIPLQSYDNQPPPPYSQHQNTGYSHQ